MHCNDVQDLLAAYLDGGIDDGQTRAEIASHLDGCADCRAERDSLAMVLAQVAPVIKAAGNAITVPDATPNPVRVAPTIRRPVLRLPFNSNHKDRDKPMTNQQTPPPARRITALNGALTFALSLVLLAFVWLIFNGAMRQSPAGGGTETPEETQAAEQSPAEIIEFGGHEWGVIRLNGYDLTLNGAPFDPTTDALNAGSTLTVSFDLDTIDSTGGSGMFVQLLDASGQVVSEGNTMLPYEPYDSTLDALVDIPPDATGQSFTLVGGLYRLQSGLRLPVTGSAQSTGDALILFDDVVAAEIAEVTPTPPPAATVDPLATTGGFRESTIDLSTLPEYVLPTDQGGGGGGGGGGCPEVEPQVGIALGAEGGDWRSVCIYGIPDVSHGAEFTLTAVSPSGVSYEADYQVSVDSQGILAVQVTDAPNAPIGSIWTQNERNTMSFNLYFPAAQEYGEWLVKGTNAAQGDFAIGTINVVASEPIYSVTHADAVLDPFVVYQQPSFTAGDEVVFAMRGNPSGIPFVIALYREDESRRTDAQYVMIPAYAVLAAARDESGFRREVFVVGTETPTVYYTGVIDPKPQQWEPAPFGMLVE